MLIPVILSGGAGTRLWPVSREAHPKPFIQLPDGQSLLQKTYLRAAGLVGVSEILTVTNRDYYFQTKDETSHVLSALIRKAHKAKLRGNTEYVVWGTDSLRSRGR